ncbi:hypothetical protein V1264_007893 [Littorina saxatilis]|uniref:Uncharacterized protein n=1 Tax=Littorina saxatilis TaxID=31220 RepID=A0AAN9G499_9CAEN
MSRAEDSETAPKLKIDSSVANNDGALEEQRIQGSLSTVPEGRAEDITFTPPVLPCQTDNQGVQVLGETGANGPLQVLRGNGGLSLHGQEFHVGGEVNVTHARNELHQHAHVTCKTYARKLVEKHVTFNNTDNAAGYEQIKGTQKCCNIAE